MRKLILAVLTLSLTAGAGQATAAVITFDGLGLNTLDPVIVDGFAFDYLNRNGWAIGDAVTTTAEFDNGSDMILCRDTADRDCSIRMEVDGGGTFSLNSFLGSDVEFDLGGRTIEVTGFLNGGGTVMASFLTAPNAFALFALPGTFVDLAAVEFHGFGGSAGTFMALDDITVSPAAVPEPGTLFLLGSGLLGLAARRRRTS